MYYLNAFNEMLKKRQMEAAAQNPMQNQMTGGGGYQGVSSNPQFDAMSNEEKAAFYEKNPTMAGITQLGQKAFGLSSYGMLQNALQPAFVSEQKAVAQGPMALSGFTNFGKESAIPGSGMVSPGVAAQDYGKSAFGKTGIESQDIGTGGFGDAAVGAGGGFGGGVGTGDFGGSPESASDLGYNQGGMVTPERLMGRAPAPDDGYGALQGGEYVITKAAVEKYGKRLLDAINNGTFR